MSLAIAKRLVMMRSSDKATNPSQVCNQPLELEKVDRGHVHSLCSTMLAAKIDCTDCSHHPIADPNHSCVVDTGCQRAAVGVNVLTQIRKIMPEGLQVRMEKQKFRFKGVGGITTDEVAVIPICLGRRPAIIRAAVLHEPPDAPLLFSLPIMNALGAVIDLPSHTMRLQNIQEDVEVFTNPRGQMCIRLFDFQQVQQHMTNSSWKPRKMLADECTVFFQEWSSQGADSHHVDMHAPHDPVESSQPVNNAVISSSVSPLSRECSVSFVDSQHGARAFSQAHLCEPRAHREPTLHQQLVSHGESIASEGSVDADLSSTDRAVQFIHPPVESSLHSSDEDRQPGVTGGNAGCSANDHSGAEGTEEKGETGASCKDSEGDPIRGSQQFELCADSRQSTCSNNQRGASEGQKQCIVSQQCRAEPAVLLWTDRDTIRVSSRGNQFRQEIPSLPTTTGYTKPVSVLQMDRAMQVRSVSEDEPSVWNVESGEPSVWNIESATKGEWQTLPQAQSVKQQGSQAGIQSELIKQFRRRVQGTRGGPTQQQSGQWQLLSACVDKARHKCLSGDEDLQALWRTHGEGVEEWRDSQDQSESRQVQVRQHDTVESLHVIPRGVRKRIVGDLNQKIDSLESHELQEPSSDDVSDKHVHEMLNLVRIGEVFSQPQFTRRACHHDFEGGRAFDLVLGDDLLQSHARQKCLEHIRSNDYDFVAVTPPCTMFSMLQFLGRNRTREQLEADPVYQQKFRDAMILLTFAVVVCLDQHRRGKFYVFEQPWTAMSWRKKVVQRLLKLPGTYVARSDQCCFGMQDRDQNPIRKRTGFLCNSRWIARAVAKTCSKQHVHQHCVGVSKGMPRAQEAARYTTPLIDAILKGLAHELLIRKPLPRTDIEEHELFQCVFTSWPLEAQQHDCLVTIASDPDTVPGVVVLPERCSIASDTGHNTSAWPLEEDEGEAPQDMEEVGEEEPQDMREVGEEETIENITEERKTQLMREIERIHRGLGHPCSAILLKILRAGRASKLTCALAKEFVCSTCQESGRPKPWRRAAPPRELAFNEVVGIDVFTLKHQQKSMECLNIICWGSRYQMVVPLKRHDALSVRAAYRTWVCCFGAPRVVKCDLGREFRAEFSERCSTDGSLLDPISLEAPVQNSITEREGKSFKMMFHKAVHEYGMIESEDEFHELIHVTALMKNRLAHRGGYSPIHRVFGVTPCLPGEIMRGDEGNHAHSARVISGDVTLQKQEAMRLAAGRAFFSSVCSDAIRRAFYSGPRKVEHFQVGDVVYFWALNQHSKVGHRNSASRKSPQESWNGPASVIAYQSPNAIFLNYQGRLVKAAPEQCRLSSEHEEMAASPMLERLCRVRKELQEGRVVGMQDIRDQPKPNFPEDHPTFKRRAFGKQAPAGKRMRTISAEEARESRAIDLDPTSSEQEGDNETVSMLSDDDDVIVEDEDSSLFSLSLWCQEHSIDAIQCWNAKTQTKGDQAS